MAFQVEKLIDHQISPDNKYFLDSNIWLKVLAPANRHSEQELKYLSFFDELQNSKGINIVVPALIISEVMNRLLRDVHMKKFKKKIGATEVNKNFYKEVFRPTLDYRNAYSRIADDFRNYLDKITFINDGFGDTIKYKHVLSHIEFNLDFNDCYYYHIAKKRGYYIVTDDKDFWVRGVKVLTQNRTLLEKQAGFEKE